MGFDTCGSQFHTSLASSVTLAGNYFPEASFLHPCTGPDRASVAVLRRLAAVDHGAWHVFCTLCGQHHCGTVEEHLKVDSTKSGVTRWFFTHAMLDWTLVCSTSGQAR